MKVRTFGIALLGLALAGIASSQEPKKEKAPSSEATPGPVAPAGPRVTLETSMGTIVVELDEKKAPLTTANFLKYVDSKYYDGTVFHRVIGNFMIQGGGFELKDDVGTQKATNPPIKNEAKNGLSNLRGTLAMARTGDPHSATSQFFINVVDNAKLDPGGFGPDGYAVFAKVVEGMDVVDKIKSVPTGNKKLMSLHPVTKEHVPSMMRDVPQEFVVIKTARRVAKK